MINIEIQILNSNWLLEVSRYGVNITGRLASILLVSVTSQGDRSVVTLHVFPDLFLPSVGPIIFYNSFHSFR